MSAARTALVLASGAAALMLGARPALPCGSSSGGGSSSSSSSSSSDSGSSDSSSSSSEPACIETSEVVGRSTCPETRFGTWKVAPLLPRFRVTYGASVHRFQLSGMSFAGEAPHGDGVAYRVVGDEISSDGVTAMTMDLAITGRIGRYAYTGLAASVGTSVFDAERIERPNALSMTPSGGLYAEFGALGGIAIPFGSFTLGAEALAARRIVGLSVESQHLDCQDSSFAFDGSWLLETRVTAEAWVSPWFSVGARVGSNALERGDVTFGVFLQGHTRAFDSTRSR